jgi:hypothetical protein
LAKWFLVLITLIITLISKRLNRIIIIHFT